MKYVVIIIIVISLIAGAGYWLSQRPAEQSSPITQNKPQPSAIADAFCQPSQLTATIDPAVAAGNYYGAIKITNSSNNTCQVMGNNQLEIGYPNAVTNFKTQVKKAPTTEVFTLKPDQEIYALIHFSNGPQCSSVAVDVNAMVGYQISPTNSVEFKPTQGTTVNIPSCGKQTDITIIDLYGFKNEQVMPN